jgi:hypothetical protein
MSFRRSPSVYVAISKGMSEQEVEEVLGTPPGCYARDESSPLGWHYPSNVNVANLSHKVWQWDHGAVVVYFDSGGKTVGKVYQPFRGSIEVWISSLLNLPQRDRQITEFWPD